MAALPFLALLAGCQPSVTLAYMRPAEVALPPEVRTVAVVDRARTPESGVAVDALVDALAASPRLEVANPAAAADALAGVKVAVGAPLDAAATAHLCAGAGATGVVSLERMRLVGEWRYDTWTEAVTETVSVKPADCDDCEAKEQEVTRDEPRVRATWEAGLTGAWAVHGCDGTTFSVKELSFGDALVGEGSHETLARMDAGEPAELARRLASEAGVAGAEHISPHEVTVERVYYRAGSPDLAAGHRAVRAGDWDEAERRWKAAADAGEGVVEGKALFDLALAAERRGDLGEAHSLARKAKELLGDRDEVVAYVDTLGKRRLLAGQLEKQMRGAGQDTRPRPSPGR